MENEKIYAGSAKKVQTNYGEMMKISLHKDDINKMVSYMKENGSDFINLDIKEKQNKQEGKPTHYLEVNTWKPSSNQDNQNQKTGDGLPF